MTAAFGFDAARLRRDARTIWQAGVDAVDSARLVQSAVQRHGNELRICGERFDLSRIGRLCVVGGGKAGAGMAAGLEESLGTDLVSTRLSGWVNVPDECVRPLRAIHLHAARPAGRNEPTIAAAGGAARILELVAGLGPDDVCIVLLSGGGSALLPAPVEGVSLDDKVRMTRLLSRAGATIQELNCVRTQLSRLKGSGLAHACRAGALVALIISDVIGDPLDVIASGPTEPSRHTAVDAISVLHRLQLWDVAPDAVRNHLQRASAERPVRITPTATVSNHIIGNNRTAVLAAAAAAERLGYEVLEKHWDEAGIARDVGARLAERCIELCRQRDSAATSRPLARPQCIVTGGEPVVHVVETDQPQKGGRNQELIVAALVALWDAGACGWSMISGGTDGEDGPTDAAGGCIDSELLARARRSGLSPIPFLAVNNTYPYLDQLGGLLKTGPTHTNVMDLRVLLIDGDRSAVRK